MSDYGKDSITQLEGLEAVRKRPGMYIGSTDIRGLHHLVQEVVDNSIDEATAGFADTVEITIDDDGGVIVEDNGRGIPVGDKDGSPAVNIIMTSIHAGGKFDSDAYQYSGGLHGVGVSVVNALSEKLDVEIKRDGHLWKQTFVQGVPQGLEKVRELKNGEETGTKIKFWADDNAFETTDYQYETLLSRIQNLAYLNPGIEFTLSDLRGEKRVERFIFESGISEFVSHLNEGKEELHEDAIRFRGEEDTDQGETVLADISLQWTQSTDSRIKSFANNIETVEGGTHETGFKTALTRCINNYANNNNLLSDIDKDGFSGNLVREGMTAVINVKHSEPQFEGQTKTKLGNSDARGVVSGLVTREMGRFLEENPDVAESIVNKAIEAYKAKKAAQKAEELERKSATVSTTLPGKLSDCQRGTSPDNAELFVVEGDSAGGCFTGETEVALASGEAMTFEELVKDYKNGEKHYCYTVDYEGKIQIGEIKSPRVTEKDATIVEVTLSNGESIECTPDHEFMLRSGEYVEAQNLQTGDPLMPLYRKKSDTYEKKITIDEYEMVKQPIIPSDDVGYKRNNRPDNIERMSEEEITYELQMYNLSVKSVEVLERSSDVYDIEVPDTHNFALESGVFVHNSAKQARNPENQAILPLRGKILNVEKNKLPRILEHDQIRNLITALGTGINNEFDIEDLRYKTVIIFTDADVDGAHIKTLLLTFLFRHVPELIENGHIYAAKPPLYRIRNKGNTYDAMTDEEREEIIEQKCDGNPTNVQRFKGLGEMNPQQLWDTTMNPENRRLERITIEDAEEADRMFSILMGSKVEPRKRFIKNNAGDGEIDI